MLDLHFHSTRSDGLKTPEEIARLGNSGDILTCTDHDFVNTEFVGLAREKGIQTCQSVEVSAYDPETPDRIQLHITYYAARVNNILLEELATLRYHKQRLVTGKLEKLHSNGFDVDVDDFYTYCSLGGFDPSRLNNSHIVNYIYSKSKNLQIIKNLFGEILTQPIFLEKCLKTNGSHNHIGTPEEDMTAVTNMNIVRVLEHAKTDGAVASMAHPNFSLKTIERYAELLPKYLSLGLSSIEINTVATREWVDTILASQKRFGHTLTFGSDCHFKVETDKKHNQLGDMNSFLSEEHIKNEVEKTLGSILR